MLLFKVFICQVLFPLVMLNMVTRHRLFLCSGRQNSCGIYLIPKSAQEYNAIIMSIVTHQVFYNNLLLAKTEQLLHVMSVPLLAGLLSLDPGNWSGINNRSVGYLFF